jgi:hypothetical protein
MEKASSCFVISDFRYAEKIAVSYGLLEPLHERPVLLPKRITEAGKDGRVEKEPHP